MEGFFLKIEKNKIKYTRVTDVLFPLSGLKNIPPDILKNAAERGTKVHEFCDAIMQDLGFFPCDQKIGKYIESFMKWLSKEFIPRPDRFYCDELRLTGECDAIYRDEGGLVLVDIKTPVNESKTWMLQGSAYSYLAKKAGYDIKRIEFVQLSKDGKEPKVYVYDADMTLFIKCLEIYRYFNLGATDVNPYDYI